MLKRIVSMLTRLIARANVVAQPAVGYDATDEYEYRDAEYEYDSTSCQNPADIRWMKNDPNTKFVGGTNDRCAQFICQRLP
jgi:hypothetical protein